MIMLEDFDLAPSDLPTDRPLTYDETQMLKKGDVVKIEGIRSTVKEVTKINMYCYDGVCYWDLNATKNDVYFVSHGKEESKEEKKEEVKGGFNSVTFNGVPIHSGNLQKECLYGCDVAQETMFDYMEKHREEHRKFLLRSTKDTKSVSQIIYGR